jgi:hypothetical protein
MFPPEVSRSAQTSSGRTLSERALSGGARRAEDLLPSLAYKELVESLGPLTELGVFEEGSLATALVVARLVDRGRILRSGLTAKDLTEALATYRQVTARPIRAIERALTQAITMTSPGAAVASSGRR